ncbi:hypothetical protein [Microbacterium sp.]|uniref:hypothetical protein n=1 Tax=Microbacterium sp. TaxID=51671 RepID=UPI0039E512CE
MISALRAEWGKTFSLLSPILCLAATLVIVVITALSLGNDFVRGIDIGEQPLGAVAGVADVLGPAVQFGNLTFAAFAMVTITAEYSSGSIHSTFQAQPRRAIVLAGKTVISIMVGLLSGTIVGALGLAAGLLALEGHTAALREPAVVTALRVGVLFAVTAILVIAIGVIVRSAVGTLAVSLVMLVGMLALPPSVSRWTPAGGAAAFVTADNADYPAFVGISVVAAWAAATYMIASVLLQRRDA